MQLNCIHNIVQLSISMTFKENHSKQKFCSHYWTTPYSSRSLALGNLSFIFCLYEFAYYLYLI